MKRLVVLILLIFSPLFVLTNSVSVFAQAEQEKPARQSSKRLFQDPTAQVEVVADQLEYLRQEKKMVAKNNVVVSYEGVKLTADYAEVETETKKAYARGHVILFEDDEPGAQGEEIFYDFENHTGSFPNGRTIDPPWYGRGADMRQVKKGVIEIDNAEITTCDLEKPHYVIKAKKAVFRKDDKIFAQNVTVYVLGKPMFWWPYFVIPLQQNHLPISISPGYSSDYGAYIETTKGFSINQHMWGKILADWRSKRGFGAGGVLNYDFGKHAKGDFIGYWTQDERAPATGAKTGAYTELEDRDRGRLSWRHRTDFDPYTHVILRYHRLADEFFLQDFFEKEHRADVEPQSFVTLTKNSERYGMMAHLQKRMNRFESLVERMPEIRLDWKNQPFFMPWLFYESQASFANLSKRFGRSGRNEDVVRLDNVHEWFLPMRWKGIKLTPSAFVRGTYYSRERYTSAEHFRFAMGGTVDLRTQFYKTINATFDKAGIEINNLRHIFEPSIRYTAIHPSTVGDEELNRFDHIDQIDDKDVVTFGLENRLQTKRVIDGRMQRIDIVSLNTFLNYAFNPDEPTTSSNFKILRQEAVLRPYHWLQYEIRFDYDMERDQFRALNQDLLAKTKRFKVLFGHRFVKDPSLLNNVGELNTTNQFVFEGKVWINPLWQLGGYIRWDADDQELEEWQVSATRDLHDFILDFGYNVRNSDIENSNKELFFNFRLKAFPEYALRGGGSRASFSEPRIGETVAGANQLSSRHDHFHEGFSPYSRV